MKQKPETYAAELKKQLGVEKALYIAGQSAENTKPDNWGTLPKAFNKVDKRDDKSVDIKHLEKLHNFWKNVFYVLRKASKNVR